MSDKRKCSSCQRQKPVAEFRDGNRVRGFKCCSACRDRQRKRNKEKANRAQHYKPAKPKTHCDGDGCTRELTRNRTTFLDGQHLCHPCWAKRWK